MNNQFSAAELEKKTVEELRAMLADNELLPLDDESNTDAILKIMEVIKSKEHKTEEQREAERVAFWTELLARHGDKIPVRLDDVVNRQKRRPKPRFEFPKIRFHFQPRMVFGRLAAAVVSLALLLAANVFVAYAFNFNVLKVIVSFTDDVFTKTIVSTDHAPTQSPQAGTSAEPGSLQSELDMLGIVQPKAPTWLPEGYEFYDIQIAEMRDRKVIAAQYKSGEQAIVLTIIYYNQGSRENTRDYEKSAGNPSEYVYNGIVHYIFSNMGRTVATWLDELCDIDVQGNISVKEMKKIINSMY